MSDFLQALLARSFGTDEIIQPRPAARFENEPEVMIDQPAEVEATPERPPEIEERRKVTTTPAIEVHQLRLERAAPAVERQQLRLEQATQDQATHLDPVTLANRNSPLPVSRDRNDDPHPGKSEREEVMRVREERILEAQHAFLSPKPTEIRPVSRITAGPEQLQSPKTPRLEYSRLRPVGPVEAPRNQDVQVHVTIGKIEVGSAPKPPSLPKVRASTPRPAVTLNEYLRRRDGGRS